MAKASIPTWVMPLALTVETAASGILTALILERLMHLNGPPASVTTLLPGLVYASATVWKVAVVSNIILVVYVVGQHLVGRPRRHVVRSWGTVSLLLTPLATIFGALAAVLAQNILDGQRMIDLSPFARIGVFVTLGVISTGALAALFAMIRGERPLLIPALGAITNTVLIAIFWWFQFHAPGFHQDTWAPQPF